MELPVPASGPGTQAAPAAPQPAATQGDAVQG
jgi:hypothetical protein